MLIVAIFDTKQTFTKSGEDDPFLSLGKRGADRSGRCSSMAIAARTSTECGREAVVDVEVGHLVRSRRGIAIGDPAEVDLPMLIPRSVGVVGPERRPALSKRSTPSHANDQQPSQVLIQPSRSTSFILSASFRHRTVRSATVWERIGSTTADSVVGFVSGRNDGSCFGGEAVHLPRIARLRANARCNTGAFSSTGSGTRAEGAVDGIKWYCRESSVPWTDLPRWPRRLHSAT